MHVLGAPPLAVFAARDEIQIAGLPVGHVVGDFLAVAAFVRTRHGMVRIVAFI